MDTVRAQQNDTLDLICWRHYGHTEGVTEAALLANPGLAELGPILPHGQPIALPAHAPRPVKETINLWT